MSAKLSIMNSREEWLKQRNSQIGGSDAACILGQNPWKTNQDLYDEKMGIKKPEDLSHNSLVAYGVQAEPKLRELFSLDFPELEVLYEENNIWTNEKYPFAHASLDGWLMDEKKRNGILEIKTATISGSSQKAKWKDGIPQNYYVQILHYLMVTEFDFAILKAQLKYEIPGSELFLQTKHYRIERSEVEEEIQYLIEKEVEFADNLKKGVRPTLILPEI